MITALLFALAGAVTVAVFTWGLHLRTADQRIPTDLMVTGGGDRRKGFGPLGSVAEALGGALGPWWLARTSLGARARMRRRIERAGRPGGMTLEDYARNKAGNVLLYGTGACCGVLLGHLIIAALLLGVGLAQTDIVLWNVRRERQTELQRQLPDFLDVLSVTVSAGLGFRQALERVAGTMAGPLPEEMQTTLRQMELGRSLREAFQDLRQRNDSEQLSEFVTAILQAEELGAPLSTALSEISVDMRRMSAQLARRRAHRVDPQITMVTTFLMVPAMIILLLAMLWYSTGGALGHVVK